MSVLSCLDQAPPATEDMLMSMGLFSIISSMMFFCIALVALTSPLIRRAYRKRVMRLMGLNQVAPRPQSWWDANIPPAATASEPSHSGKYDPAELGRNATAWERKLTVASYVGLFVYIVTGWVVARWVLHMPTVIDQIEFVSGAGVLALIPMFVNLPESLKRLTLKIMVIVVAATLLGFELFGPEELTDASVADEDSSTFWSDLGAVILLLTVLASLFHRRLRGLILPSAVVITIFILTLILPLALFEGHMGSCLEGLSIDTAGAADENSPSQQFWGHTFLFIAIVLGLVGIWLGFLVVGLLARAIDRGWISDISMVSLIGLALVSVGMLYSAIDGTTNNYPLWLAWVPLLWMVPPVLAYLLVLGRRTPTDAGRALLMLRVFSKDKKTQSLLDKIQSRWRYLGAVNQAGGPDLVDLNVDPYECSMFLSGRLHELYLPQALTPQQLASRFPDTPDREGRYRVNEMFNFNTAWRENVEQLASLSETILLDLRGLSSEREGTSFEIGLLAKNDLLSRVVAIGDEQTDWNHVEATLQMEGHSLDQLKQVSAKDNLDGIIAALLTVPA